MSTGSAIPAPIPSAAKSDLLHTFLDKASAQVTAFEGLATAIENGTPFPTAFAKLEIVRTDLKEAYSIFTLVGGLLTAIKALPPTK